MTDSKFDISGLMKADAKLVEEKLISCYKETTDPDIGLCNEAEKYSLLAGGKRIRPFLVLEFCKAFGGDSNTALSFAAAIEMMHTFSLIHDDLPCMDNDDLRRGRPTSHVVYGEANALLCGDSLSIRAFETIADADCDAELRIRAVKALATAAGYSGMIAGQITDLRGEKEKLSIDTLHKLHSQKTGAMIRLGAILGCISAGLSEDSPEYVAAVRYADKIGLVFQIIDDILDVTSDNSTMGKTVGKDANENKTTFMTYMSVEDAFEYAKKLTDEAKDALKSYKSCEMLCEFADVLLYRKK